MRHSGLTPASKEGGQNTVATQWLDKNPKQAEEIALEIINWSLKTNFTLEQTNKKD